MTEDPDIAPEAWNKSLLMHTLEWLYCCIIPFQQTPTNPPSAKGSSTAIKYRAQDSFPQGFCLLMAFPKLQPSFLPRFHIPFTFRAIIGMVILQIPENFLLSCVMGHTRSHPTDSKLKECPSTQVVPVRRTCGACSTWRRGA